MDVIRLLPESIANQIAAGEVVPGPSYIVKELLENSIDAGSTSIKLEVIDGGKACIHVLDNGKGMTPADARMAFEKHATSKISSSEDLYRLATMGFRGEALAAIAAVARVELNTRPHNSELGTRILIAGSEISAVEVVACAAGASIQVKDIFFNTPARRRFLKASSTEYRAILREFERVALVNPSVSMSIYKDNALDIDLPAASLKQRILQLGGNRLEKDLLPIQYESERIRISGYIGKPNGARPKGAQQFLFVNNRYMEHRLFRSAIMKVYDPLIETKHQPNFYIYFTLPPENIDVNINPTKTEVRFVDETIIYQILQSLVREALSAYAAVPVIDFSERVTDIPTYTGRVSMGDEPNRGDSVSYGRRVFMGNNVPPPLVQGSNQERQIASSYNMNWDKLAESFEAETTGEPILETSASLFSHREMERGAYHSTLAAQHLIYKQRYLVTSLRGGLTLIDYQRATMRILYDKYMTDMNELKLNTQGILYPERITLSPSELAAFRELEPRLSTLGFECEIEDESLLKLLAAPTIIADTANDFIQMLLGDYLEDSSTYEDGIESYMALMVSKLKAREAQEQIAEVKVTEFITELFASSDPNIAPNGKKIAITLTDAELERLFHLC